MLEENIEINNIDFLKYYLITKNGQKNMHNQIKGNKKLKKLVKDIMKRKSKTLNLWKTKEKKLMKNMQKKKIV